MFKNQIYILFLNSGIHSTLNGDLKDIFLYHLCMFMMLADFFGVCVLCSANCLTCIDGGVCLECSAGYTLKQNRCSTPCAEHYYHTHDLTYV